MRIVAKVSAFVAGDIECDTAEAIKEFLGGVLQKAFKDIGVYVNTVSIEGMTDAPYIALKEYTERLEREIDTYTKRMEEDRLQEEITK